MRTLNITPQAAEDALARLAAHVPAHVDIGRPHVAMPDRDGEIAFLTETGWWWSYRDHADRLDDEPIRGHYELTSFRDGREMSRVFTPVQ